MRLYRCVCRNCGALTSTPLRKGETVAFVECHQPAPGVTDPKAHLFRIGIA